jgi:hypothetical protein
MYAHVLVTCLQCVHLPRWVYVTHTLHSTHTWIGDGVVYPALTNACLMEALKGVAAKSVSGSGSSASPMVLICCA